MLPVSWFYRERKATTLGRGLSRFWAAWASLGLPPRRQVQLEVVGRRSGRPHRLALVVAKYEGREHLVSMLGEGEWVKNVRAAGGEAFIVSGRRRKVSLQEIPVGERAPIIQAFLRSAPGGRPHLGLDANATLAECDSVAPGTPVFRVVRNTLAT
ncbi:MAG: nitroreductase family deazaflavin-dependent oxidoreductase [Chloroflexota bacterium]|nr:nitroreductase family deazaflavin-dependent oxidoreductase [Chloroflexota bacterium]MDE3192609.1 nitroreductase family deazaflavin-dependent oxidoreductase [Chloroflexota bacterium]